jgi:hypothetical protein
MILDGTPDQELIYGSFTSELGVGLRIFAPYTEHDGIRLISRITYDILYSLVMQGTGLVMLDITRTLNAA